MASENFSANLLILRATRLLQGHGRSEADAAALAGSIRSPHRGQRSHLDQ
jgi:hypothetical protein